MSKAADKLRGTKPAKQVDKGLMAVYKEADMTPPLAEQGAAILAGEQTTYAAIPPEVDMLDRLASNHPRRLRGGTSTGAKPMLRRLLGTPSIEADEVKYPRFTVEELCELTKKGEINIRTCLADLRSPKYCGAEGPFVTVLVKDRGFSLYQYSPEQTAAIAALNPTKKGA